MGSILSRVRGQVVAVDTLRRALRRDRVHHAYRFDGPDGVGKELAAFGLAQALVCERRAPDGDDACGACSACTRVLPREGQARPVHPDVVILERGLYEPAQIGRRSPETQDLSIDQVRTLVLARAAFPPHEGRAKVFIVRRADELSISAANALLKTLEEPGARTHFVLLTSTPDALLPTILSRTLRVRFAALDDELVRELLVERGVEAPLAGELAALAAGSLAAAAELADPAASDERAQFVARAMASITAETFGPGLELAEGAKQAKAELPRRLLALASKLAAEARAVAATDAALATRLARRHAIALEAIRQLDGNAAAQLAMEAMILRMRNA